ncbi:MAG: dihydropteroate synthase, partial [Planctomycetota bacterium]
VHHAVRESTVPKHLDDRLVLLRDAAVSRRTVAELDELAESIRDYNYRLFVGDDALHLVGMGRRISSRDPFVIAQRLIDALDADERSRPLDPSHAFYLGFELAKAATALTLGKHYEQDEPLDWGFLTQAEESHYLQRKRRTMPARGPADGPANGPAEGEGAP